jgi:hypothetical protein
MIWNRLLEAVRSGVDPGDLINSLIERGYDLGTVRSWATGEYKKTRDGWVRVGGGAGGAGGQQRSPAVVSRGDRQSVSTGLGKSSFYSPDPRRDSDGDGVADSARVGIPGKAVLPPPSIPRLPNLPPDLRRAEESFASTFEENADDMVDDYLAKLAAGKMEEKPGIFSTDDAKLLSPDYSGGPDMSDDERKEIRARNNVALHQTANALAKRAFVKYLDTGEEEGARYLGGRGLWQGLRRGECQGRERCHQGCCCGLGCCWGAECYGEPVDPGRVQEARDRSDLCFHPC